MTKVSVVCAVYNRAEYIGDTIDSLLSQDLDDFEIVVVNDGSPDPKVRDVLDAYDDPRLRVIHQENTGFTMAISRAIEATTAPFIAIQGAGDVSSKTRLRLQYEALRAQKNAAIAGCYYRTRNFRTGEVSEASPAAPVEGTIVFNCFSHGELMYRRSVYNAVGGYRTVFSVGQGSDLWMRLMREHVAVIIPSFLYEQRYFSDGVSLSPAKRATRHVIDAVRVENETLFRQTGFDHIDHYGAGAFGMLGGRWGVRRETARAILKIKKSDRKASTSRIDAGILTRILVLSIGLFRILRIR